MSTTTLSQRLRDLRIGLFPDIETVNEVLDECIAQAEREAQAGELSVERIMQAVKRAGSQMPYGHINYDMIRAELTKNGPVVAHLNMDPNASPETIEAVKDVVQKAYSYKPSQAIGGSASQANPVIGNVHERWHELGYGNPDRLDERFRGDPWRIFYAGWIEGRAPLVIQLRDNHRLFTEARDALAEYRDKHPSPVSPEARDKAIHALQVSRITHKAMCREDHVDMIDDAISALRGQ